ncbi:CHASE2 domain-containing protein [Desulforhopalus sp. IMCC35007]|uniref:CHASE2 domain-containing protein n=1 Tax=Desulforhopalus sp. IMCC35007 TaxID=2569543 RepID=UPI0010AE0B9D|nr:CHASE2 domain-containing protein [Desulforhopalus sp. IMCC35007]TKB11857.1 CHASE2 domain-containing protein [Desulforhopalus sp. IMCC35007]
MLYRPKSLIPPSIAEPTGRPLVKTLFYTSLLLSCVAAAIYMFTPLGYFLDLKTMDFLLNASTQEPDRQETITVEIDDATLQLYGQWPWPRYRLARLLDNITSSGAKAVAVNILFPEPDRTSPVHWQKSLQQDFGYTLDTSNIPATFLDHDAFLAETLKNGPYILGYELLFQKTANQQQGCLTPPIFNDSAAISASTDALTLHNANGILCNNGTLSKSGNATGFFNGTPDRDGIFRRLPLYLEYNDKVLPSFALQIFLKTKKLTETTLQNGLLGTRYILNGTIPIDREGNYLLGNFSTSPDDSISAKELLDGASTLQRLKDKVVFVGLTATGLSQYYRLPNGKTISMSDIHKLAYKSLAAKKQRIRGDLFWLAELPFGIFLTSLLSAGIAGFSTPWICTILFSTLGLLGAASIFTYKTFGLLLSPIFPASSLLLSFFFLITLKYRYNQKHSALEAGNALQLLDYSQKTLQSILNTIPDIIFRLDQNGKIIFISSAVSKYNSHSHQLLGKSIFDLVVPQDLDKAKFRLNERRTGSRATQDFEIRLQFTLEDQDQTTQTRYFSVSAAGLYDTSHSGPDKFIGTQGIVKDITKRKHIESQLLQAKKMEALGNLAAGIAHDLNNILSGLVTYPDIILADIPKDDPLHKKISIIKKSGEKAAVIVQDLLTLARRNIKHQDIIDLNTLLADYLDSAEHRQTQKKHSLTTIRTEYCPLEIIVSGSSVHLSKAIMNLINNAMEAMPSGGEIFISTSLKNIQESLNGYEEIPPGKYGCITIKDSGMGISDQDLTRIFEPFYTKKPSERKGTGLGMTIIWATIKDHKGYIDISSKIGEGAEFTVYLPITDQPLIVKVNQDSLEPSTKGETILIVDDMEEQLTIAGSILSQLGYSTMTAGSGNEALEMLNQSPVDLVILDMIMPNGMDGLETYEHILEKYPNQRAIISSGYSESDRVKRMQQLGAGGYVQKPYSIEALACAVRKELDR